MRESREHRKRPTKRRARDDRRREAEEERVAQRERADPEIVDRVGKVRHERALARIEKAARSTDDEDGKHASQRSGANGEPGREHGQRHQRHAERLDRAENQITETDDVETRGLGGLARYCFGRALDEEEPRVIDAERGERRGDTNDRAHQTAVKRLDWDRRGRRGLTLDLRAGRRRWRRLQPHSSPERPRILRIADRSDEARAVIRIAIRQRRDCGGSRDEDAVLADEDAASAAEE